MARYDEVEVFETYSERWIGGYEVADRASEGDAFLVRRQNDGVVLPAPIPADRIRAAHSAPRSV